jgi:hypothetical protein
MMTRPPPTNDFIIDNESSLLPVEHLPNTKRMTLKRRKVEYNNISKIAPSSIEYNSKHVVDPVDPDASPTIVLARTKNDPVVDMAAVVAMSTSLWIQHYQV